MINREDIERFKSKVSFPSGLAGCWIWNGTLRNKRGGYGEMRIRGKLYIAHRISWEIINGKISDKLSVLHKCDNPPCVNPNHLFLGTQKDNISDMVKKGRNNYFKVLNQVVADEIRVVYSDGNHTQEELGRIYGVNRSTIGYILRKKTWNKK